jgi:hypothetical protein
VRLRTASSAIAYFIEVALNQSDRHTVIVLSHPFKMPVDKARRACDWRLLTCSMWAVGLRRSSPAPKSEVNVRVTYASVVQEEYRYPR